MIDQSHERRLPSRRPTTPSESTITPGRVPLHHDAEQIEHAAAAVLERQLVRRRRRPARPRAPGAAARSAAVFVADLLPRAVVDAIAQHAVIGRRVVEDLELRRRSCPAGQSRAGLDPQLRALAACPNTRMPGDAERLAVAARAADRGASSRRSRRSGRRAGSSGASARWPARDEPAPGVAEPLLQRHAQPRRHRVAGGVRVAEEQHAARGRSDRPRLAPAREPGVQRVERAGRRVEDSRGSARAAVAGIASRRVAGATVHRRARSARPAAAARGPAARARRRSRRSRATRARAARWRGTTWTSCELRTRR